MHAVSLNQRDSIHLCQNAYQKTIKTVLSNGFYVNADFHNDHNWTSPFVYVPETRENWKKIKNKKVTNSTLAKKENVLEKTKLNFLCTLSATYQLFSCFTEPKYFQWKETEY